MSPRSIALVLSPSLADNAWRPLLWVFGATALLTVVGMVDDIRVLGSVEPSPPSMTVPTPIHVYNSPHSRLIN